MIVIGCEPISVSVNTNGDIAFTRCEGTFYINLKTNKLNVLDWNYGKESIPVIVRWSPKGDMVALTIKENKDAQSASVYLIDKKGKSKKIFSGTKIITQLEWSTDGSYISFAQAGKDTNMSVADIGLISVKDGMSKIILENCGDVHKWLNNKEIVIIKVNEKNSKNSEIYLGNLIQYKIGGQEITNLSDVIIAKNGGLDCNSSADQIAFTAIKVQGEAKKFEDNMIAHAFLFLYNLKNNKMEKVLDDTINFVKYSPDNSKILVKVVNKQDNKLVNLAYIDAKKKTLKVLIEKTTDKVNVNSTDVQVYPEWLDNNNLLFWRLSTSYGSNETLQLMTMNLKSGKKKNLQVFIDTEVNKLVEAKGGY
jgi:tricorn protease-like protein